MRYVLNEDQFEWFYYYSPYARYLEMLFGMIAATIYKRYKVTISYATATILEVISLIFVLTLMLLCGRDVSKGFIVGIGFAVVVFIFSVGKGAISKIFSRDVFSKLSVYCFAFYLFHPFAIKFVEWLFEDCAFSPTWIKMLVVVPLSFVLSVIFAYVGNKLNKKIST